METKNAETKNGSEQVRQYLTFLIGGEEYAVSLLKVKEIIEYDVVTKVPKTPAWVRGVINLRGSVVPVIDLAVKFGQAATEVGKLTCIVITEVECEGEAAVMGILADAVSQVIDLKAEEIEAPPTFGTRVKIDYLLGMGRSGKKFCLILDSDRVLSTDELLEVASSLTASSSEETNNNPVAPVALEQPEIPLEA
ncbi:MAG TPA: chemotaxis protein CheW [Terriglobales bacterium]|nr:chemotaxis protein CheW [Terriglobales bacterium]